MHRLLVIIALLLGFSAVTSPTMAASTGGPIILQALVWAADDICMAPNADTKIATFKPCAKGANGKSVLPCHLPPMIVPASATLPGNGQGGHFAAAHQHFLPSHIVTGHFRPPRAATV